MRPPPRRSSTAPCFKSNRGVNKKDDRRPGHSAELFTEHPAIAIYFIDSHLLWLLSPPAFRVKQRQVKICPRNKVVIVTGPSCDSIKVGNNCCIVLDNAVFNHVTGGRALCAEPYHKWLKTNPGRTYYRTTHFSRWASLWPGFIYKDSQRNHTRILMILCPLVLQICMGGGTHFPSGGPFIWSPPPVVKTIIKYILITLYPSITKKIFKKEGAWALKERALLFFKNKY